jgi:hypothetical protein
MEIPLNDRITAFVRTGEMLRDLAMELRAGHTASGGMHEGSNGKAKRDFRKAIREAGRLNPWFTNGNIARAMESISRMLEEKTIRKWLSSYQLERPGRVKPRIVLIVMAGNIPLVGFHDLLCVLISGHRALIKTSSLDPFLPLALAGLISEAEPQFKEAMIFSGEAARGFDAVIATGSNNSARYFSYYFGKVPHIIRKNRNSLAVLTGEESAEEIRLLGDDVFSYFGLGCRNVSQLWVPAGYPLQSLAAVWEGFGTVTGNTRYLNNLLYQKAISQVNKERYTDLGFGILREDAGLASPLSVIHYQVYGTTGEAVDFADHHAGDLQCLAGRESIIESNPSASLSSMLVGFGQTQNPSPWDYADRVDTIQFLTGIS